MTSRRTVIAGLGSIAVSGLAGCSALPFGDENDTPEQVSLPADIVEPIAWPASPFPAPVPSTLAEAHRERIRELLDEVPSDPSIPNSAIAEELGSDRARAADRLEDGVEEPWPTEELSRWRARRSTAASVRGAYRAAIGEDDGAMVRTRRRTVREELGSFLTDHEYRATSPRGAVLAHAPIEDLVTDCHRRIRPDPAYPPDPVARPFLAGDAVGRVDHARATLADARGLKEAYLAEEPDVTTQWATLIRASERLGFAVSQARSTVRDFLEHDEPPFDPDLEGTPARWQYRVGKRRIESGIETYEQHQDEGHYANAVIEAGRALAAVAAFRTVIDEIRDGAQQDAASVESVERTGDRAREAVTAIEDREYRSLAALMLRQEFVLFESIPDRIEEWYADATRLQGELAWVEPYAHAVPSAIEFVIDRLHESAGE